MDGEHTPGVRPAPLLAGVIGWAWAWWVAAIAFGGVETPGGVITYLVGGLGPALAVAFAYQRSDAEYRRSFRRRLVKWRAGWLMLAAAFALAVGPKSVALLLARLGGHSATGEGIALADVPFSLVFFVIVVWIEEPFWRGIALDGFRGAWAKASLVIGAAWSVWHMPLFLVEGTWQADLGFGGLDFWTFSVAIFGLSVILTWLVAGSGGSVLIAMLAHLLINANGEFFPDDTTIRVLEAVVILVAAAIVFMRLRPQTAARRPAVPSTVGR